jgi:signal peptidase I
VRRRTKILLGLLGITLMASVLPMRTVASDEMSPSIRSGDTVWVVPGATILQGDVVALLDPLDPERTILRRAIAGGGTSVRYTDDGLRVGVKRLRLADMGVLNGYTVHKETIWTKPPAAPTEWLIRRRRDPSVQWEAEAVDVPEDHWYLLADDRDDAVDSRWWGPIPAASIQGVVRMRYGPSDLWRPRLELLEGTE